MSKFFKTQKSRRRLVKFGFAALLLPLAIHMAWAGVYSIRTPGPDNPYAEFCAVVVIVVAIAGAICAAILACILACEVFDRIKDRVVDFINAGDPDESEVAESEPKAPQGMCATDDVQPDVPLVAPDDSTPTSPSDLTEDEFTKRHHPWW